MSTVLFLTPRYPWPLIGGDRIKSYHLLRYLATKHRVILVTFCHGSDASEEQLNAIRSLGIEVHSVTLSPLHASIGSLRTFWTRKPIEIAFYHRPEFQRVVDSIVATTPVAVGIAFFMRTAEYIRHRSDMRKVLIAEDCRVEYQTRSKQNSTSWLQRVIRSWEIMKLRSYEASVVDDFDTVTFVSNADVVAMHDLVPSSKYEVVTNGVDLERFSFNAEQGRRSGVLFVGKLDVHANELMVDAIVNDIMPIVRQALPDAHVTIVGGWRRGKRRVSSQGVTYTGRVPDHVSYLHEAAVFLHPHSGGSGIQNKVLEAMAAGCAVVTTTSGLLGIDAIHGVHCLIATSKEEAALYVRRLLTNIEERATLVANARKLMLETHSWDLVNTQIDNVVDQGNVITQGNVIDHGNIRVSDDDVRTGLLLDRDGIINTRIVDGYVRTADEFELVPEIIPLLRFAHERGMPIAVITNQQGVGRGLMTVVDLAAVHNHMLDVIKSLIDGVEISLYVCTSLQSANDPRRKPNPGMVLEALHDLRLNPATTWFIGDSTSDAEAGRNAGVRTLLVGPFSPLAADVVVPDLHAALEILKKN
ncbi:MAG: HAD-IIIA family hydrolase [bacterium]|nr:HAD-IIIA family hydrolase [bacterium]